MMEAVGAAGGKLRGLTLRELLPETELEATTGKQKPLGPDPPRASYPIPEPDRSLSSHWMLTRTLGQPEAGCGLVLHQST